MQLYHVIVTGVKRSDGKLYRLRFRTQTESLKEAYDSVGAYDWSDAHTMLVSVFPDEASADAAESTLSH